MRRARELVTTDTTPEHQLERAVAARTPTQRAKYARLGLATRAPLDRTTQAMLLRQLYLAHFEARRFGDARRVAEQLIDLRVLQDVAHQDAARACTALGDADGAIGHLRLAVRRGPPSRRAFHLWTLGSTLHLAGRDDEAFAALTRALRWGTTDKPLFAGHLALVRLARGERPRGLARTIARLEAAACGRGYGRFVLGMLAVQAGHRDAAIAHLSAFVERSAAGRPAVAIALEPELAEAHRVLRRIAAD